MRTPLRYVTGIILVILNLLIFISRLDVDFVWLYVILPVLHSL